MADHDAVDRPADSERRELIELEREMQAGGAMTLTELGRQPGGEALVEAAVALLGVRTSELQFFAPGGETNNVYTVYRGRAIPISAGSGAALVAEGESVIDTPRGPRTICFRESVLVSRTGERAAEITIQKAILTSGAAVGLVSRIGSTWSEGFEASEPSAIAEPLFIGSIEPLALAADTGPIRHVVERRLVGSSVYRVCGEAVSAEGRAFAIDEQTIVEPRSDTFTVVRVVRRNRSEDRHGELREISWIIAHPAAMETVMLIVERRGIADGQLELFLRNEEITNERDGTTGIDGQPVAFRETIVSRRLSVRCVEVVATKQFASQSASKHLVGLRETFLVTGGANTELQDAHLVSQELVYNDGETRERSYPLPIRWRRVIVSAAAGLMVLALLGGLVWRLFL